MEFLKALKNHRKARRERGMKNRDNEQKINNEMAVSSTNISIIKELMVLMYQLKERLAEWIKQYLPVISCV